MLRAADEIDALRDALLWCGGSPSFGPGGEAEEGWRAMVEPLFRTDLETPSWRFESLDPKITPIE